MQQTRLSRDDSLTIPLVNMGKTLLWPRWYRPPFRERQTGRQLVASVCRDFGITLDEFYGRNRQQLFVSARAVVAQILRERGWSTPKIGQLIERDHSSVLNLLGTFDKLLHFAAVRWCYDKHREMEAGIA